MSHPHEEDPYTTYIQEKLINLGLLDIATGINDKNTQEAINPKNEKGKITLISRYGHKNVEKFLPKLIRGIKKEVKILLLKLN